MAASSSAPSAAMVTVSLHLTARPMTAKIFLISAALPFFVMVALLRIPAGVCLQIRKTEKKKEVYNTKLEEWKKELKVKTYEDKLS